MKFVVDNNANAGSLPSLRVFFRGHEFSHTNDHDWSALDDVDLFAAMAREGCRALITRDKNQLSDPDERTGLLQHGIVWIGVRDPGIGGLAGLSIETASLLVGLPHVLGLLDGQATAAAYSLRAIPNQQGQRVRVIRLDP